MNRLARCVLMASTTLVGACLASAPATAPTSVEPSAAEPGAAPTAEPGARQTPTSIASASVAPTVRSASAADGPASNALASKCLAYGERVCACKDAACARREEAESRTKIYYEDERAMGPNDQQRCNTTLKRADGCRQELVDQQYERYAGAVCACTSLACFTKETTSFRAAGGKDPLPEQDQRQADALTRAHQCHQTLRAKDPGRPLPDRVCKQDSDCVKMDTTCSCYAQHRLEILLPWDDGAQGMICTKDATCGLKRPTCEVATGWCRLTAPDPGRP